MNPSDRRATGRAHFVLQHGRMFARLQQRFCTSVQRLGGELNGRRLRNAHLHTAIRQRLDYQINIGRPTASNRRKGIYHLLRHLVRHSQRVQDHVNLLDVRLRHISTGREHGASLGHLHGRVGHAPDDLDLGNEVEELLNHFDGDSRDHGHEQFVLVAHGANVLLLDLHRETLDHVWLYANENYVRLDEHLEGKRREEKVLFQWKLFHVQR